MPEAQIILAQAATYLASAPKSNASYVAIKQAMDDVRARPLEPIPLHLRNAATGLLKDLGYGKDYKYPHDFPGGFVRENYFPEGWQNRVYYRPGNAGAEEPIRERLKSWWPDRYDEKKE